MANTKTITIVAIAGLISDLEWAVPIGITSLQLTFQVYQEYITFR